MKGWILNLSRDDASYECERDQEPVLVFEDGERVYEVWLYYARTQRWFVMATKADPAMAKEPNVVYFHPHEVPEALRAKLRALEMKRAS